MSETNTSGEYPSEAEYFPAPVPLGQDKEGNWVYYEVDLPTE